MKPDNNQPLFSAVYSLEFTVNISFLGKFSYLFTKTGESSSSAKSWTNESFFIDVILSTINATVK